MHSARTIQTVPVPCGGTRAEIESIAIALYESQSRYHDGVAGRVNHPWAQISVLDRGLWRTKAQDLLKEPLPC